MPNPHSVGHFEILEPLGAGGMGEVFKARDRRLNRLVAIKFLPEAASVEARERFQREALAIAALSHPHICTLYEVGEEAGRPYLVLELLEGETLRARLARGALAPETLVDWAVQIADGLDAAHKRGVLHRDLKPDNIFVSPSGHIKVLDFGLARLDAAPSGGDEKTLMTSPGVTLGTVPYMSPEQARGEALDARSDVFSFGAVSYEMAAGRAPFPGGSAAEIIAGILKEQPAGLRERRPELPPKFEEVVGRCLEKDPELRYQSAADLRSDLKRLGRSSQRMEPSGMAASAAAVPPGPASTPAAISDSQIAGGLVRRHWRWPAVAAVLVAIGGLAWWRLAAGPAPGPVHLQFHQITFNGQVVDAVISPDGKFLAHVDKGPAGTSLHLLSIPTGSDVQIMAPAPGCCQSPSFSPDGSEVTFVDAEALKEVPVLGGQVRSLAEPACSGAGFSPDGSRIAYLASAPPSTELMVANADGSQARVLNRTAAGDGYLSQCWVSRVGQATHAPAWSPDGRWIAVAEGPVTGDMHAVLISAADGNARRLGPGVANFTAADLNWLPGGRGILFTASIPETAPSQMWEISYPGGQLTQLTDELQGYAEVSLANPGQLAAVHAAPQSSLWVQSRAGGDFAQLPGGGTDMDGGAGLAWTPSGGLVSMRNLGGQHQLWTENSDGSDAHALPLEGGPEDIDAPTVAPNGQIAFRAGVDAPTIWRVNGDGSGLAQLVSPAAGSQTGNAHLIQGGRGVVYMLVGGDGTQTLWTVPLAGGTPRQAWPGFVYAGAAAVSPDGTRILVVTKGPQGGHARVIVRLDGGTPQVSPAPLESKFVSGPYEWTADGRALTFIRRQGSMDNIWAQPLDGRTSYAITHFTDLQIHAYAFFRDGRLAVSRGSQNSDVVIGTGLAGGKH